MPWIIVSANGEELDRRELTAPVVIGRSPECDVVVRDIMLSRQHCRLEPVAGGGGHDWRVVDLKSKNGTRVGWQQVTEQVLKHDDHLRMGRTRIVYYTTPFEPAPDRPARPDKIVRPADPHEALSGTVTDFVLVEEDDHLPHREIHHHAGDRPLPRPKPYDPAKAAHGAPHSAPHAHASAEPHPAPDSPLDVLAATVGNHGGGTAGAHIAGPTRTVARALPRVPGKTIGRLPRRPGGGETDLSLQVTHDHALPDDGALTPPPFFHAKPVAKAKASRKRRLLVTIALTLAAAIGTGIVVVSLWLLMLAPR
jgi:predicted component of type VI protein secretion system